MKDKFNIQEERYVFPYHHLMDFQSKKNYKILHWGFEYYAYTNRVIELIKKLDFSSLLDVGCGDGKLIYELSKIYPKKELVGVDLSEKAILYARAFNYENSSKFFASDVKELEGKYDVVTLIETLEHIPEEEIFGFVANIKDKLNKNGWLIVTVPTINAPLISKHYRHYDESLLDKHLSGFKLEKSEYVMRQGRLFNLVLRLSGRIITLPFLNNLLFLVSRKFLFSSNKNNGRHLVAIFRPE